MRKPRSEAPIFAASSGGVLVPSPMTVKTSSSIPVFRASVFWNAFISAKMRSGVGRFVVEGVAMRFVSVSRVFCVQIYTDGGVCQLSQFLAHIRARLAYFLSPAQSERNTS